MSRTLDEIVLLNHGKLEKIDINNLDDSAMKDKILNALKESEE